MLNNKNFRLLRYIVPPLWNYSAAEMVRFTVTSVFDIAVIVKQPHSDNTPYEKIGDEVRSLADEVPFDIPDSWEWVTLQTIATSSLGKTLDKAKNKGDLKPYLCSINVYWDGIDLTTVKEARLEESELSKYLLRPGDLLICEGGDVGRSAVWESTQEMYYQNALHRVRFYGGINPHYFQLLLECYKGNQILDAYSKGMTIKHLVQTALNTIVFPLPPLSEQTRIVDAVNRLLPYLHSYDKAEQKLTALNTGFPEALKKSILQEAVQGKLVSQDPSDESAEALLERIRAEKQRLIKEGKIKKDKHESVIFRRDNSHYEKLDGVERCIDDELPFEIPDSWEWVRLGAVLEIARGGSPRPIQQYLTTESDGINWIKIGDTDKGGKYIFKTKEKIHPEGVTKSRMVHSGDFLLTNSMSFGRPYILKTDGCIHDGWLVLSNRFECYSVDFLYYILSSPFAYYQFCDSVSGAVVKNLNSDKVANALFPLPPLSEQHRIVQRIEELFSLIKAL